MLDENILNRFRDKVKEDSTTQREVLEALMEAYCKGDLIIETNIQRRVKFK